MQDKNSFSNNQNSLSDDIKMEACSVYKEDIFEEETKAILKNCLKNEEYKNCKFISPEDYSKYFLVSSSPYLAEKNLESKGLILSPAAPKISANTIIGPFLKEEIRQGDLAQALDVKVEDLGFENVHYSMPVAPQQTLDDYNPNLLIAIPSLNAVEAAQKNKKVCPVFFINHRDHGLIHLKKAPSTLTAQQLKKALRGTEGYALYKKDVFSITQGIPHLLKKNVSKTIQNLFPKEQDIEFANLEFEPIKTPYIDDLNLLENLNTKNNPPIPLPKSHNVEFYHVECPSGSGKYEIVIVAIKDIHPGEELLTTYGEYFLNTFEKDNNKLSKNIPLFFNVEKFHLLKSNFYKIEDEQPNFFISNNIPREVGPCDASFTAENYSYLNALNKQKDELCFKKEYPTIFNNESPKKEKIVESYHSL